MSVKPLAILAVVVITLALTPTIDAQAPPTVPTNQAMRIAAARRANAALMRQYSWTSRTEVIDQGQVKDLRIAGCISPTVQGSTYYLCGNTWFQPSYGANGVSYRVVPTP